MFLKDTKKLGYALTIINTYCIMLVIKYCIFVYGLLPMLSSIPMVHLHLYACCHSFHAVPVFFDIFLSACVSKCVNMYANSKCFQTYIHNADSASTLLRTARLAL